MHCKSYQIKLPGIKYENNYFATNETKLRSFQIKLNLRSIVTDVQRAGFGIIDSNHCAFCSEEPETIILFFFFVYVA